MTFSVHTHLVKCSELVSNETVPNLKFVQDTFIQKIYIFYVPIQKTIIRSNIPINII